MYYTKNAKNSHLRHTEADAITRDKNSKKNRKIFYGEHVLRRMIICTFRCLTSTTYTQKKIHWYFKMSIKSLCILPYKAQLIA